MTGEFIVTDIVSSLKRSEMMAGIRGRNTAPEIRVRSQLHRMGYRYRLHRSDLPGTPDILLPKRRVAIFVHGCFWHLHNGCKFSRIPKSREDFWLAKLTRNRERDETSIGALHKLGWRVLVVWECYLRRCKDDEKLAKALSTWINEDESFGELSGIAKEDISLSRHT